ncbi:arginyl-tRNA synthetase [Streptomyces sp. PTM05]|uniref:arginine--tRNA ligase n=1 Tax=Streptantibioticus parmotrematis TaxID=2873249 RepID=A0ABS7QZJ7_9ACTN|nr:arginine--tRNA ligase [Streptantibioticus parmotrematis]MBY8888642.1 arginyl-tRNA synthetase [Streptantibioticus parmotrematis]
MTPGDLSLAVRRAVRCAVDDGELGVAVPDRVDIARPRDAAEGDYAVSLPLRLAKAAGLKPLDVADALARRLTGAPGLARVAVAPPGFLNVTLDAAARAALLASVRAHPGPRATLGDLHLTPVHDGEPRAAAVADALTRMLRACGAHEGPPAPVRVRPAPTPLPALTADALRWALVRPPARDTPALDPAVLLSQRHANPLFRIQYAHARAHALLRGAAALGITPADGAPGHPAELALLAVLADHPRVVTAAARDRAPDRLARALESTADAFFDFHDACPALPFGDEKPSAAHRVRLALADAAAPVLAGGLALLGIGAPDHL